MKRWLGLMVCMLPMLSVAEVVVPIDSVEKFVNIRMSPDAKSEIVGRLQQGDSAPLVQSIPQWHEVEIAGGATGFISADWTIVLDEAPVPETGALDQPGVEVNIDPEIEAVAEIASATIKPVQEAVATDSDNDTDKAGSSAAIVTNPVPEEVPAVKSSVGESGLQGPPGNAGPPGPQGPPGAAQIEGSKNYLMKFTAPTIGGNSQVYDDGNNIGIGTTEPEQRLEVNGNIQIHERNSSVAGLLMTQSTGETGYIMHNRASTLTIGAGSVDRITIDREGNVGIGTSRPVHPIEMASGAYVSAGGVWTNSSSRGKKENIGELASDEALAALAQLEPVTFNYRQDPGEQYVGFIAEDVPELVASADRTGLSAMDIVAILTRVVQLQQQQIADLESRLADRK